MLAAATVTSTWPGGAATDDGGAAAVVGGATAFETGGAGVLLPPLQAATVRSERDERKMIVLDMGGAAECLCTKPAYGREDMRLRCFRTDLPSRVTSERGPAYSVSHMRLVFTTLALALASCGPPSQPMSDAHFDVGTPTRSQCPSTPVTWSGFGQTFFATYCTTCHSSSIVGAARNGAPVGYDYDSAAMVRPHVTEIDEVAASGPGGTNTTMPFRGAAPSVAERAMLGQLLACGVPD